MGFRYDMRDKTNQQQAIVRQRDAEEKRRNEEYQKKKDEIVCKTTAPNGDYASITLLKDSQMILELRVSGTAIANGPCGLNRDTVMEWLCVTGKSFIEKVIKPEVITLTANDIRDGKVISDWKNIKREKISE